MPEKTAPEERSASFREMPRTRQTLSVSQMRVLLNALMRTPVGVVQQVGFLLMLFVALVEASLPDTSAPPTASIAVRDVAATAHDHVAVTTDEKEWSAKLIAFAKVKQARGERLMGKGGTVKVRPKGVPNVKVETLRRWAVRRNKKMPSLLRLLQATPEIGTKNALLIQYHAGGISRREAGKALSAAAAALSFVTRAAGDAIHADVAAAETRTAAVVRVQALARGVVTRRTLRAANAAASVVQAWATARAARHKRACSFTTAPVRVQPATPVALQALWRGVMSREALFRKTIAAVTLQRWSRLVTVVRSLVRTRTIAGAHGAHVLQLATVCVEFRFRALCKLSLSMSAYSRAYCTAATLLQRKWTKVVKHASLAARCHVFREAHLVLGSLIRRHSQQTGLDGVIRVSNLDRCPSKLESAKTPSTRPKITCLEAEEESWLVAAETMSKEERQQPRGKRGGENVGAASSSCNTTGAARQRSLGAGAPPSGRTIINDLPALISETSLTSDSIASFNRSSHDDRSSTLLGVVQLGAQPASPTFADDIEHPQENNSSAQLSSNGRSDDKIHPPDCGRPVRLPVDTPELQFAPIPLVFDMVPDATTSSSPDWGGPERGNVSLSPKKEAVTLNNTHGPPSETEGRSLEVQQPTGTTPSSSDQCAVTTTSSAETRASLDEPPMDYSQPIGPSNALHANHMSSPPQGDGSPMDIHLRPLDEVVSDNDGDEPPVGEVLRPTGNTNNGTLVGALSTAASVEEGDGLSTVYDTDDENAAMVWSREGGSIRPNSLGLLGGALSTAASFEEGDELSTVYDTDDANAAMVWSREDGSCRSNSLGLPSEAGSGAHETSDTSDGSVESNDPPTSALASMTSSAPPSSIGSTLSLLGLGLLGSRSGSLIYTHDAESEAYTQLSTPPRREENTVDNSTSPERRCSTPLHGDRPGATLSQQIPYDVASSEFFSRNPAAGTRHELPSIPESAVTFDETIVSPTGSLIETEGVMEVKDARLLGGSSQTNTSNQATIRCVLEAPRQVLHPPSPTQTCLLDKPLPSGTHSTSSIPSPTTMSPHERWRRCEGSPSYPTATPGGGCSWWIPLSDAVTHAVRTPPPMPSWIPVGGVCVNLTETIGGCSWWVSVSDATPYAVRAPPPLPSWLPAGGLCANLTDAENNSDRAESPASDAHTHASNNDEVIIYSTGTRERSFLERAQLSDDHNRDRDSSSGITAVCSKGDISPKRSNSSGFLTETGSITDGDFDGLCKIKDPNHLPLAHDLVSSVSSAPLSEGGIALASPLGLKLSESAPTPTSSVYAKTIALPLNVPHGASTQLPVDGLSNPDGVHSKSERRQSACSPTDQPTTRSLAKQPTLQLAVAKKMPSMVERGRAPTQRVGGQLSTIEEATITLDQAIVWPSDSSANVSEAPGATNDVQVYGGGQIIGVNGDIILSADPLASPLEAPRTPSPSGRHSPPSGTAPSPSKSSPSVHSTPRRRRRREGSSTGPGAGRPRNLCRSASPSDACNAINTPPSSPDRLRVGTAVVGLADDGRFIESPQSCVSEAAVLRRNDTGDSALIDDIGSVGRPSIDAGANSVGLLYASGSDTSRPTSISDRDSDTAFSQAPQSVISLLSAPCSNVALNGGGLSGITLGDVGLRDVGVRGVVLSDVDIAAPLLDNPARYDESTPDSPAAQRAESKKTSVESSTFEWLLGEPENVNAVPLPEAQSAGKGGLHTEGAAFDVAARQSFDEDMRQPPRYDPLFGVEEFKWSGLPNNNIG